MLLVPLLTAKGCAASHGILASTQPAAVRMPAALQLAAWLHHHQHPAGSPAVAVLHEYQLLPGLLPGQQQMWWHCRHATGVSQGAGAGLPQRLGLPLCQALTRLMLHCVAL